MLICHQLHNIPLHPISSITIGNFDGVHLGHQKLLTKTASKAYDHSFSMALTFLNHPRSFFQPNLKQEWITPFNYKTLLIEKTGIDLVLGLVFDESIASQTAQQFLTYLHSHLKFEYLTLGPNARLGRNKEGNRDVLQKEAEQIGFSIEFITPFENQNDLVSSTKIRDLIKSGSLEQANLLLGRPYALYGQIETGLGIGKQIGFPTLNIAMHDTCLPPLGVYAVTLHSLTTSYKGIANLGYAPTIKQINEPILEIHLLETPPFEINSEVVIEIHHFLREEKKFQKVEDLKQQIYHDIKIAKDLLCIL